MNILILSWRGPGHPHEGGAEQIAHEHAKAWVKSGHKVTLYTSSYPGAKSREMLDGVRIIRRGSQILEVHFAAFIWYLLGKHSNYDLVIDHFHGIPFFTPFYIKKPKLAVLHEVAREVWKLNHLPQPFNLIVGYIGYYLEPMMFFIYRRISFMVGSQSAKDDLVKMGISKKNVHVVHHGVKLDIPKTAVEKERRKTVIYLGAIAKDKGIEDALKVFARVNDKRSGWQYWIVGTGDPNYLKKLKAMVNKLDIERCVKFFGYKAGEKKFRLLARAHVFLNPSIREGWGLVNIEANAVGTPVVGYKVPGLVDSVKDGGTGLLSKPRDLDLLSDNLIRLIEDKALYNRIRKNAIRWGRSFSWEKATKESIKLIESL